MALAIARLRICRQLFQFAMLCVPLGSMFTTATWLVLSSARQLRSARAKPLFALRFFIRPPRVCAAPFVLPR
ncbi:hypothetical protein D3C71_1858900 [compost metagenome]